MAWYGPSGECGCCGEAAQCLCDADCACGNPENDGDSLVGKRFSISGFPDVIELKVAEPSTHTLGAYTDYYYFVSGLNQFNGTYDMVNATSGDFVYKCLFNFFKEITVYVQVYRSGLYGVWPYPVYPPCGGVLSEQLIDGNYELLLRVNHNGVWAVCAKEYPFQNDLFGCQSDICNDLWNHPNFQVETTLCGGPLSVECEGSSRTEVDRYLKIGYSPSAAEIKSGSEIVCQNHSYIFSIDASVETIIAQDTRRAIEGWTIAVSEIKDKLYVRTPFLTGEVWELSGLEQLNGTYFLPNVRSDCSPKDYVEEVNITWKKLLISETSPCTIVETGESGTATGKFYFRSKSNSNLIPRFELRTTYPNFYIFDEPKIAEVYTTLDCTENCDEYIKQFDECAPDFNQTIFKVCAAPRLS